MRGRSYKDTCTKYTFANSRNESWQILKQIQAKTDWDISSGFGWILRKAGVLMMILEVGYGEKMEEELYSQRDRDIALKSTHYRKIAKPSARARS